MALGGVAVALPLSACTSDGEQYGLSHWRTDRGERYFVAHRGSGDVFPEHSLEAYEGAIGFGAKALEISVVQTSDGVLICQHDLSFDRTTNLKGLVKAQPSSVLLDGRIDIPWLGPKWQDEGRPRIPRLDNVLRKIGKRAVLFIEPKDDGAFPGIMRLVKEQELQSSVMLKLHHRTQRIPEVRKAGMSVFCYIGDADELVEPLISQVAEKLDPERDVLAVPAFDDIDPISDDKLQLALDTGLPVWVFPVHRRWQAEHFHSRGVHGIITSSFGYVSRSVLPVRSPGWGTGGISGGQMTRFPDSGAYALEWPEPGVITLAAQRRQAFLTLGDLAPLEHATGPYSVSLEIRVDKPPTDVLSNFTLCFGHDTDKYYKHRQGTQNGYHAILRMDGTLEIRVHEAGSDGGEEIAKTIPGPLLTVGTWIPLQLDVDTEHITWTRQDSGATTTGKHSKYRGDYIHIGRSAIDGKISVRDLKVS